MSLFLKQVWSLAQWQSLLEAKDFRSFLNEALKYYFRKDEKVNYAEFSRKLGFSSRSYLSELLSGKKGLSSSALMQIKSNLKLPKEATRMLELHAFLAFPELRPLNLMNSEIESLLAQSKNSLMKRLEFEGMSALARTEMFKVPTFVQVYAALGSTAEGASITDIRNRTNLSEQVIENSLQVFMSHKMVSGKGLRFYPIADQLDFLKYSNRESLPHLIHSAATELARNSKLAVEDPNGLVFYTAIQTDKKQLPFLKKRLEEALESVLEEFHDAQGNTVRQVLLSTTSIFGSSIHDQVRSANRSGK